ncbi:MAG: T9SS type A sorting domain-containing protein [Candidatus Zhuqueibacterota bacterium]
MKLNTTKLLGLLSLVMLLPLISGCFTILSIDQATTANGGDKIQTYLEVRTEGIDANAHYGIVGLLIPTGWVVDSVFFSGDYGPDFCTFLHPDSADNDPGGQVDYWTDSLNVRYPAPAGMNWVVYQSSQPFAAALDTGYADLYVDFTVGNTSGDYNIGYFVTNAALDFTDPTYYAVNLANPINVVGVGNMVTFQCDMSIKQREASFDPAGDIVVVRGNFNGWGGNNEQLTDANADTIYTGTFNVGTMEATIYYKHVIHKADGSDVWESDPNREFANSGTQTLPVVFFDRDDQYTPPGDVFVTFQCDMSIKMREEVFVPGSDIIVIRGNFNGWAGNADELLDADADSIYSVAANVGTEPTLYYKYVIHKADGTDMWEGDPNRELANPGVNTTLDPVYFDRDDEFSGVTKEGAILFTVDMEVWENAGFFDRNLDSLMIRGGFNGWASGDYLERFPGTMMYERIMTNKGIVGDNVYYKYYINYADTSKWKEADWGYEVPYTQGGGNRFLKFAGTPNQEAPISYMNDIPHGGVIPLGQVITLTFNVDMNPALTLAVPFNPATDTVKIQPQDPHWAVGQGYVPYADTLAEFTDPDGDLIYTGSFQIHGPTIYGMEYAFKYGDIVEGGGFDFGRYRTRYIEPNVDGTFPNAWVFPTDTFTEDPPLDVEEPPIKLAVDDLITGTVRPENYSLGQNYPNPFNPTTMITYSIPKFSMVTVRVYNMLGQEVATLVNGYKVAGNYSVSWDAKDYTGRNVSGGIYFYRIEAGDYSKTMKMLLLK